MSARQVGAAGQVLAFEPSKASFQVLKKNVHGNALDNVRLFQVALADRSGIARLYHAPDPGRKALGCVGGSDGGWESVSLRKLDKVLELENVLRLDVIKLDVEGAEELVLRGGERSVRTWRPVIVFEVNAEATAGVGLNPTGAIEWLHTLDYELYFADGAGHLRRNVEVSSGGNLVALPSGLRCGS